MVHLKETPYPYARDRSNRLCQEKKTNSIREKYMGEHIKLQKVLKELEQREQERTTQNTEQEEQDDE